MFLAVIAGAKAAFVIVVKLMITFGVMPSLCWNYFGSRLFATYNVLLQVEDLEHGAS